MVDVLVKFEPFILKLLVGVLGTFFGYLNKKYELGIDPIGIATTTGTIILGIAIHYAAKDHGVSAAKAANPPADAGAGPGAGAGAVNAAAAFLIGFLALGALAGCSAIDKATLQEFQSGEALILKDMAIYVAADVAAGKMPAISQSAIDAHLAKINADPRSVDPAEEQAIMSQFIAYLAADPKISSGTMKAWGGEVHAHMDLFTSVHR